MLWSKHFEHCRLHLLNKRWYGAGAASSITCSPGPIQLRGDYSVCTEYIHTGYDTVLFARGSTETAYLIGGVRHLMGRSRDSCLQQVCCPVSKVTSRCSCL